MVITPVFVVRQQHCIIFMFTNRHLIKVQLQIIGLLLTTGRRHLLGDGPTEQCDAPRKITVVTAEANVPTWLRSRCRLNNGALCDACRE